MPSEYGTCDGTYDTYKEVVQNNIITKKTSFGSGYMLLEVDFNNLTVHSVKFEISSIADSDKIYTLISASDYITNDGHDKGLESTYKVSEESIGTASFAFSLSEIKTNCA